MRNSHVRLSRAGGAVCAAALILTAAVNAHAFKLKHTSSGHDIRWNSPNVEFVVDPALDASVPGGAQAVASAAQGWSSAAGAPTVSTTVGPVGSKPALDRKNSVLFLRDFEPAGGALAITIVSFEEATGNIVDTDVVISKQHSFQVLTAGARAQPGSPLVSTEGRSESDGLEVFDLTHVAAHEFGHALGLADESTNVAALMYPYTKAGDASVRYPGSDDLSGIDQAYAGANLSSGSAKGCGGGASVAGRRTGSEPWAAALLFIAAGGWLATRRRGWGLAPFGIALVALVAVPGRAESASPVRFVAATARVTAAVTRNVDGVFRTRLELAPGKCATPCPARLVAQVWGGTIDGITQQVGEQVAATLGDEVDVWLGPSLDADPAVPSAVIRAVRPAAAGLAQGSSE
jgi:hypothetical protein